MGSTQRLNDIQDDWEISAQGTSDTQWSVLLNVAWLEIPLTQGSHQRTLTSRPNYIYCSGSRCQGTKLRVWFLPLCGVIGLPSWEPYFTHDGMSMSLIIGFIQCKTFRPHPPTPEAFSSLFQLQTPQMLMKCVNLNPDGFWFFVVCQ